MLKHCAKAKHCYCSFGAETMLPALGSIFFDIHKEPVVLLLVLFYHYAKAKHCYCSFGVATVLPALGSINLHQEPLVLLLVLF